MIIYLTSIIATLLISIGFFGLLMHFLWRFYGTMTEAVLIGLAPIKYGGQEYHFIYDIGTDDQNQLLFTANPARNLDLHTSGDKQEIYVWDKFQNIATSNNSRTSILHYSLYSLSGIYLLSLLNNATQDLLLFAPLMLLTFLLTFSVMYRRLQDLNTHKPAKIRDLRKFKNTISYRNYMQHDLGYSKFGLLVLCCVLCLQLWHDRTKIALYLIGDHYEAHITSQIGQEYLGQDLIFPRLSFMNDDGHRQHILNSYGYLDRKNNSKTDILYAHLPNMLAQDASHYDQTYKASVMIKEGLFHDFKYLILMLIFLYLWIVRPSKFHL